MYIHGAHWPRFLVRRADTQRRCSRAVNCAYSHMCSIQPELAEHSRVHTLLHRKVVAFAFEASTSRLQPGIAGVENIRNRSTASSLFASALASRFSMPDTQHHDGADDRARALSEASSLLVSGGARRGSTVSTKLTATGQVRVRPIQPYRLPVNPGL
eukprot:2006715-Rhodomonas_salina.2